MRFTIKTIFCAALVAGVVGSVTYIAPMEKSMSTVATLPTPFVTVEGLTEYRLSNGLRVVLYPDSSKPTATVCVTYLVGSRQENYGETGMAHLLEHLMFKGSKNYPHPTKEFTKRGFQINGSTWLDRTNYHVSFTANDDNMNWALGWMSDAMVNSFIAQKDLDTEMTVVRNEFEMGENSPTSVMLKRMQSVLFDWHSYGRNTIGARSDIENVEIANLQAFYRRYYQPDNAVLVVTGQFDDKEVLKKIHSTFGAIEKPTRLLPHEWTVEPVADGERVFTIRRPGEGQLVSVAYRLPAALSEDYEPLSMGANALAEAPSGRLYKALVETKMASDVFAWTIPGKDPGFVMFGAMVDKNKDLKKVEKELIDVIENTYATEPMTQAELDRQKNDQATMFERTIATPEELAITLSDYIALGDWRLFFANREEIAGVELKDVERAWPKIFVRDNRVVGRFIPENEPKRASIASAPEAQAFLSRFSFKAEGAQVESFDVSQDNINNKTLRFKVGDIEVALLAKPTMGKTVAVAMKFLNGNNQSNQDGALGLLSKAMLTRGTDQWSRLEIDDKFIELKIEGSPTQFITDRDHLEGSLQLVGNLLSQSTFPKTEFDTLKSQSIERFRAKLDDPMVKAHDALAQHFNTYPKNDARYSETSRELVEGLEKVTLERAKAHYDNVFGTERGFIAIVGDFDPDEVKALLNKTIISQKRSTEKYERIESDFKPVEAARLVVDTPAKENGTLMARVDFKATLTDSQSPALIVADWILGGSAGLSNRIVNRLRQKEGLSYGARSSLRLPSHGTRAAWTVTAIVAPQNLKQAEMSLKDELRLALEKGITEEELNEAKRGIKEYRMINRSQDSTLASGWISFMKIDRNWDFSLEAEKAMDALTLEEVNRAIKTIANIEEMTFVLAGDVEKAKQLEKDFSK